MPADNLLKQSRKDHHNSLFIGKVFGIKLSLDYSWIIIFLLIAANLSINVFSDIDLGLPNYMKVIFGILTALLFSASIIAHEVAHSLVAQKFGLPVEEIKLFIFGGVAHIKRDPTTPLSEFLITLAGPVTSILLGGVFGLISFALNNLTSNVSQNTMINWQSAFSMLFYWLAPVNIFMGIFNLLPGFPLDGGRILRSIIWQFTGDNLKATKIAAFTGQGMGWILVAFGTLMIGGLDFGVFGGGIINGFWLAFVGWFLVMLAKQQLKISEINQILSVISVRSVMQYETPVIPVNTSLVEFINHHLSFPNRKVYLASEEGRVSGVFLTESLKSIPESQWQKLNIGKIMEPIDEKSYVKPDDNLFNLLSKLKNIQIKYLPVIENGNLLGIVGKKDIFTWLKTNNQIIPVYARN